jgi:Mor family transcriptional regulator
MSELSRKYNVPENAIKAMIKDGVISCSYVGKESIYHTYKVNIKSGMPNPEAIKITSFTHNCSDRWVYEVVREFE